MEPTRGHAFGATEPGTCTTNSDCRELDFWLGDWTVQYPGASFPSSSKVSLELDKCLLVESWDGGKGHRGKNMFAYSSDDKKWHGMFADNQGRVHVFEGKVASGSAEFLGPSMSPDGKTVLNRIRESIVKGTLGLMTPCIKPLPVPYFQIGRLLRPAVQIQRLPNLRRKEKLD